jgi:membrane protein
LLNRLKSAWAAGSDNNISLVAAGIAHYALLALVPALGAVVLGYGLFADPATVSQHITTLADVLPPSAATLIGDQLEQISQGSGGAKGFGLLIALALALIGARGAANALLTGLNIAFEVSEPRSFLRSNLVALAITLAGIVALAALIAASAALSGPLASIIGLVLLAISAVAGAMLLYHYAPAGPRADWSAALRGGVIFAILWIVATGAFAFYASNFTDYNATYGSLGAVVALITWFWVSGFALLFGAEIVAVTTKANAVG